MKETPLIKKVVNGQPLAKFLLIGGGATLFNYCVFLFLYSNFAVRYEFAFITGFLAGVGFGYLFNFSWTFRDSSTSHKYNFWRYFCVYLASLGIGLASLQLAVQLGNFDPRLANFFSIGLTTCINYTGLRNWVFKQ